MKPQPQKHSFPGGSKSRVNKAGLAVKNGNASDSDMAIIEEWRAAHSHVLNTFQAILRNRLKGKEVTIAQRHKRKNTIFNKLNRFPKMELSRMDDVAGCRLIFKDIKSLYEFRGKLHNAKFKHRLKNEIDRYDYIKNPKKTGYRGIHDIYIYDVNSDSGKHLKGLYIEIQYRTLIQHSWATAAEVIGNETENAPKFQKGDERYLEAMSLASEILARAYENEKGPYPEISNPELLSRFIKIDQEILLLKTLKRSKIKERSTQDKEKTNIILIFKKNHAPDIKGFKKPKEALQKLFELEKENPMADIVLVKTETNQDLKLAFKNYFNESPLQNPANPHERLIEGA